MKKNKLLIFIVFIFSTVYIQAQEKIDIEVDGNYYFKDNYSNPLTNSLRLVGNDTASVSRIIQGSIVKVVKIENDRVYFKFWNFVAFDLKLIYNKNTTGEDSIFSLPVSDFQNLTQKRYNRFRGVKAGAYTIPIRLRSKGNTFEFDSDLSLGTNIAASFGHTKKEHLYVDVSLGISLTQVNLNEDNSNLGDMGTEFEDVSTLSSNAFTISLGLVLHPAKNINLGIFYGWDFLSGSDQTKLNWIHNRKPWVGLGINIAFTKSEANKGNAKDQDIQVTTNIKN